MSSARGQHVHSVWGTLHGQEPAGLLRTVCRTAGRPGLGAGSIPARPTTPLLRL